MAHSLIHSPEKKEKKQNERVFIGIPHFPFTKIHRTSSFSQFTVSLPPSLLTTRIPHGSIALATGFAWIGSFFKHQLLVKCTEDGTDSQRSCIRLFFWKRKTSWWFQPTWKMLVKLDHFPYLKPPPRKWCCLIRSWKIQKNISLKSPWTLPCIMSLDMPPKVASREMPLELWKNDPKSISFDSNYAFQLAKLWDDSQYTAQIQIDYNRSTDSHLGENPEILLNGSCSPQNKMDPVPPPKKKRGKSAQKKITLQVKSSPLKLTNSCSSRLTYPSFPFQHWP